MRHIAPRNRGQDLVEYALILPLLLLFILGIVEFGIAVFAYNTIANAAREGARVGVVPLPPAPDMADMADREQEMEQAVIQRTGGLNLTSANITATRTITQSMVEVVYGHRLITGLIVRTAGGDPLVTLRSVATMRTE
jgi:Flp pilus assembly protein TadG